MVASTSVPDGQKLLNEADRIVVLTGAGVSADSGVPTFRDPEGLWRSYRPEELATPQAFQRDPELVWSWYAWRREKIAACRPNPAHEVLARLCLERGNATLITQNVDGLHELAAHEQARALSKDAAHALPLELHGSILRLRCSVCRFREPHRLPEPDEADTLPVCQECRAFLRPDVVWFGEPLPERALTAAFEAAREADLALVVGTSALVHPAASVPLATLEAGGRIVEVNPDPTPLSRVATVTIRERAASAVPALLES